jgi:hypothetical protein
MGLIAFVRLVPTGAGVLECSPSYELVRWVCCGCQTGADSYSRIETYRDGTRSVVKPARESFKTRVVTGLLPGTLNGVSWLEASTICAASLRAVEAVGVDPVLLGPSRSLRAASGWQRRSPTSCSHWTSGQHRATMPA